MIAFRLSRRFVIRVVVVLMSAKFCAVRVWFALIFQTTVSNCSRSDFVQLTVHTGTRSVTITLVILLVAWVFVTGIEIIVSDWHASGLCSD